MADLFKAVRSNDPQAIEQLSRLVRGMARSICRGGGPPGAPDLDWEDVAQEASRKLHAVGIAQYRGSGSERSYLYSVVKATVIQMSRSATRRRDRETAAYAAPTTPSSDVSDRIAVRHILELLDDGCRELIVSLFLRDETYADAARDLGLAQSSVRAKLSRCLKKAKRIADRGGSS